MARGSIRRITSVFLDCSSGCTDGTFRATVWAWHFAERPSSATAAGYGSNPCLVRERPFTSLSPGWIDEEWGRRTEVRKNRRRNRCGRDSESVICAICHWLSRDRRERAAG